MISRERELLSDGTVSHSIGEPMNTFRDFDSHSDRSFGGRESHAFAFLTPSIAVV